uniref:VDE lipocalin domain-containing protein n=1 Tax=Romanomermis culicivorax TaxID=13658 RepID=A0A915K4K1_ROMCU
MKIEWLIINSLLVLLLYDSNNGELLAPLEKQIRKKCVEFCQSSLICSNGCSLFSMDSRFTCDKDCPVTSTVCETGCRTAESMYIYKVQALFEKSQAVIDRNSSQKIVLAWRLEPYDLSNLLFMNNRGQTNSLLLRVEIKRPNEQFYNVLNRNIGISPSLVTADLPLDEFAAGIYE